MMTGLGGSERPPKESGSHKIVPRWFPASSFQSPIPNQNLTKTENLKKNKLLILPLFVIIKPIKVSTNELSKKSEENDENILSDRRRRIYRF